MSQHNRRDPRLPDFSRVKPDPKKSLGEIMESARKKLGVKTVWEKYGERAQSGVEKGQPEEER